MAGITSAFPSSNFLAIYLFAIPCIFMMEEIEGVDECSNHHGRRRLFRCFFVKNFFVKSIPNVNFWPSLVDKWIHSNMIRVRHAKVAERRLIRTLCLGRHTPKPDDVAARRR
jgi:hypothetical protein